MATSGRPRQVPGARRHLLPLRLQPNRWPHAVARGQAQRFAKIGDRAFSQIWKADERCVRRFPDLAHCFDACSSQSAAIAAGARAIRVRRSSRSCSVNAGREVDDPNRGVVCQLRGWIVQVHFALFCIPLDEPEDGIFANFRPTITRAPSEPIDSSCNSPSATANTCPGP